MHLKNLLGTDYKFYVPLRMSEDRARTGELSGPQTDQNRRRKLREGIQTFILGPAQLSRLCILKSAIRFVAKMGGWLVKLIKVAQ